MTTKTCNTCLQDKYINDFYSRTGTKDGVTSKCKECTKAYNRERYNKPEIRKKRKERYMKYKEDSDYRHKSYERSSKFYSSPRGRAKTLIKSAQRRNNGVELDFDYVWVQDKIEKGFCEVTGISFCLDSHPEYVKNPYCPSIDRIDSKKPYSKENVRIVIWQFNLMKGEISDSELEKICENFIRRFNEPE